MMLSPATRILAQRIVASTAKRCRLRTTTSGRPLSSLAAVDDDNGSSSINMKSLQCLFNPTEDHQALRSMLQTFVQREVEPQAMEYNKKEIFNETLFRKLGDGGMGILGLTAPEEFGGAGLDAVAVCIAHEELSYSDPAFCLSYLAHS